MLSRPYLSLVLVLTLLGLPGCGTQPAAAPPTNAPASAAPAATVPTVPTDAPTDAPAEATAAPAETASAVTPVANTADMISTLVANLTAQQPTTATERLQLHAFQLVQHKVDLPLWVVYTSGSSADAGQEHVVSIYTPEQAGWRLVSTVTLTTPTAIEPGGVEQVAFAPDGAWAWLAVKGSSGLIGPCCFDLLAFEQMALRSELSYSERNIDLDTIMIGPGSDGQPEVSIPVDLYKGMDTEREHFTVRFVWNGQKVVQR